MYDSRIQEAAYDAFLYPDEPHFWSEPSRFAAAAVLHGFTPSAVADARILEIGCASGGNIIPMAARYPAASFYGFDISGQQIDAAQRHASDADLKNITLFQADIMQLPADIGTFDFIIAHGIASWVPHAVRLGIWDVCDRLLRPNGLLYLSFNTLPGWHFKKSVRDMLLFHASIQPQATENMNDLIEFYHRVETHAQGIYKHLLEIEKQFINVDDANYIRHEYLEHENHAFYIGDMIREAKQYKLRYICDADPACSNLSLLTHDVVEQIRCDSGGDRAIQEQYIDFYLNRTFRRSIFAKSADAEPLNGEIALRHFDHLHIVPVDVPAAPSLSPELRDFLTFPQDFFMQTEDAQQQKKQGIAADVFTLLTEHLPNNTSTLSVQHILSSFEHRTQGNAAFIDVIRMSILEFLYRRSFTVATEPAAWFCDMELPRLQHLLHSDAVHGRSAGTNVLHEKITLTSDRSRLFLSLLDGTRTRADLALDLASLLHHGHFTLDDETEPPATDGERIAVYLDTMLEKIAKLKLLG